ncbi:MAG: hypothetical protein ACHQ6U_04185 [Thermodesulfobacteriota bacterium]
MRNRDKTAEILKQNKIRFLTVLWCDNANLIRSKAIYIPSVLIDVSKGKNNTGFNNDFISRIERRLTVSVVQQAMPVVYDAPVPEAGLDPVREICLIPYWSTLVLPEYLSGHALVIGNLASDSSPWELCPREMLRRSVMNLSETGFEIEVGVEIEFFFFHLNDYISNVEHFPVPIDHDLYAQNSAFKRVRQLIDEITDELLAQGIEISTYNVESGPGQHEFSLRYFRSREYRGQAYILPRDN